MIRTIKGAALVNGIRTDRTNAAAWLREWRKLGKRRVVIPGYVRYGSYASTRYLIVYRNMAVS